MVLVLLWFLVQIYLKINLHTLYAGFGQTSLIEFRLVNVIDDVDTSDSTNMQVDDSLKALSFGRDLGDRPQFNNWIYNIPSSHNISDINQVNVNTYRINLF